MSTITSFKMLIILFLSLHVQYLIAELEIPNYVPQGVNHNRIVGGEDIEISDAPYQVSVMYKKRFFCGGSLVANDIVITAAHCIAPAKYLTVRVGSSYFNKGGTVYRVKKEFKHPDFDSNLDNDIGILLLSKPVRFNSVVGVIEMKNSGEEVADGEMTQVTGWGLTQQGGGELASVLQRVQVPVVNASECQEAYKPRPITPQMLCAGVPEGGKDACQGDSGGPLVHDGKLAGVVSWGIGCAKPEYPGVYAKVSALREWVDKIIKKIREDKM